MYRMASKILEEIEQWRESSSTDDTLNSLTSIETFLEEIKEINFAILRKGRGSCNRISFYTEIIDREDQNSWQ